MMIRPDTVSRPIGFKKPPSRQEHVEEHVEEAVALADDFDQPSVFREVRGKTPKNPGARRGLLAWLIALSLLAAVGLGLFYSFKQGMFDIAWSDKLNGEPEDPYVPAAISLEPLPGDALVSGESSSPNPNAPGQPGADPLLAEIDFSLEPDFIRFKQFVKLGEAKVIFQTWRLGKLERDGEAVTGKEYVILDLRVRNDSQKSIKLRELFHKTIMLDGQERRLPNLVLERADLQGDLPEFVPPGRSELVRFVFQAHAGSGDFHLRLPGNPPRQLDLAALPAPGLAPGVVDTLFR